VASVTHELFTQTGGCLVVAGACGNVGFGKLGQFARLLSKAKVPVVALDLAPAVLDIPARLRAELGKKFDAAEVERIVGAVRVVKGGPADVGSPIGMVFEAIPERLDLKRAFYADVRKVAPGAYILSATSGFTTQKLFSGIAGADRCGVLHPFFPHLTNKLFEQPTTGVTGREALAKISGWLTELGLVPLAVADVPSFAADRVFCMMMTEAARVHADTGIPPAVIDAVLADELGARPFLVHNMITGSNRLTVSCIDELAGESPSSFYKVPPIQRAHADDVSKQWDVSAKRPATPAEAKVIRERVLGALLAVASKIVAAKICSARDLNVLCEEALAFRKGLPALARSIGLDTSRALVERYLAEQRVTHADEVASPEVFDYAQRDRLARLYIATERKGDVLVILLARASINAIYVEELAAALDELAWGSAKAAVLVADGQFNQEFGRGADVTEFLPALGNEAKARELSERWKRVMRRIVDLKKPIVAALSRRSLGGSNELASLCAARIAAAGTTIGQPEPVVGVVPGLGGTTTLLRWAPPAQRTKVARYLLTGDPFDAAEALAMGQLSAVVPPGELLARAVALAGDLAHGRVARPAFEAKAFALDVPADAPMTNAAGVALDVQHRALMIEAIKGAAALPFTAALDYETGMAAKAFTLSAARIGVLALLRGRKPEFAPAKP